MIHYLRLIRLPNLLIIVVTQYLMRFCIVSPLLVQIRQSLIWQYDAHLPLFKLQFSSLDFALLVFATVCLTAAGYVINDYFDIKTDILNHPSSVIVGKIVPRRTAMIIHLVLDITGVVIGFYLASRIGRPWIGTLFLLVAGLLWFYSTTYKRQLLLGNILVAILTAMVPFMVVLFEVPMLNRVYGQLMSAYQASFGLIIIWVSGFSLFAFLTTMTREIIKDIEDFEGDRAYGRNTLPVVIGIRWSRAVVVILACLTITAISLVYVYYLRDRITLIYAVVLLLLPLLVIIYLMINTDGPAHFHRASLLMKGIMLAGVLYALPACFILMKNTA